MHRLLGVVLFVLSVQAGQAAEADFYVDPIGSDTSPGTARLPFASVERARDAVRALRAAQPQRNQPVRVEVRPGWYTLARPLVFEPQDSGTAESPTVYAAAARADTVLSGGLKLSGWTVQGDRWTLRLPEDQPLFSLLYVNSEPRYRPRLPKTGYYTIAGEAPPTAENEERGHDRFVYRPGDLRADWHNRGDVEVLCFNEWNMHRLRIKELDEATHTVTFTGPTVSLQYWAALRKGYRFLVDNVAEALTEPGQWYLDRETRWLTYLPKPGETPANTTVVAPRLEQLLRIEGQAEQDRFVTDLAFEGLTLAHTNWVCPAVGNSTPQSEANLSAAVGALGARRVRWSDCQFVHLAGYGLELNAGCQENLLERCVVSDVGAGGVKIGLMGYTEDERLQTRANTVRDCTLSHGGRLHPAGCGIWIAGSADNVVEHNDVFDFYNIGISVGWSWGYGPSLAHHNRIADNHVWHLGQGVLSDMGGVYTLGVSPGTVIEHNLFHDVDAFSYGGWGIYFDEGSTGVVARDNLVYDTKTGGFHQHYGRDNVFENNIVAYSTVGLLQRTRPEDHHQFTLRHNLFFIDGTRLLHGDWTKPEHFRFESNLYWDASGDEVRPAGKSWAEWQALGQDQGSVIADPLFVDPARRDFRLRPGSPALAIGFVPFALEGWGRRDRRGDWALKPLASAFPTQSSTGPARPLSFDFEQDATGDQPSGWMCYEDGVVAESRCRVTDEAPASGARCLKLTDAPGQQQPWNPHAVLKPMFRDGLIEDSFDLKIGPRAQVTHEWRDERFDPYLVGPSLAIDAEGRLKAGEELVTLPHNQWIHVRILGPTGRTLPRRWSLELSWPGQETLRLVDLPCDERFRQVTWIGWSSQATEHSEMWLDNVKLGPAQ